MQVIPFSSIASIVPTETHHLSYYNNDVCRQ